MKRILTTILLAIVLAGIPIFATALNRTEPNAGLTSALASPAPASPQRHRYHRRHYRYHRRHYRYHRRHYRYHRRHYRRHYMHRR